MEKDTTGQLLNAWRINPTLPPDFNSAVWRRIETARAFDLRQLVLDWLNQLFANPKVALSYVTVALLAGLAVGQVRASRDLRKAEAQLKTRYIQSIDPYAKPMAP